MNETFKKLTEKIKAELAEHLQTKEMQEFIKSAKAATDAGSFEVVISTADIDRQGETVSQDGWDLSFYKLNPVVLWAHDYFSLPIGIATEIEVKDGKLIAKGMFAPADANPFAQQVRRLYDLKIVRATSVGFIPLETDGKTIVKAELLEFSFVPVPANPFALSLRKAQELGLDLLMLATKGLKFETKQDEPKEGDPCTMEDGTEGIMKPDAEGNLVCMPKGETKPEVTEEFIRIPVKDAGNYDPDSIRTITISEDEGIKALTACPKGEYEGGKCNVGVEIITYLFDKEKWTESEAQAWVDEHAKSVAEKLAKGEIADQAEQEEKRKQKWEKLNRVWDIFDAFVGVYLDDATAVEDFEKLLEEAIALMRDATGTQEGKVAKALHDEKRARVLVKAKDVEKIGTELAALQNEVDDAIVRHAQAIIEIVRSEYGEEEAEKIKHAINQMKSAAPTKTGQGGEGEERRDGVAPKQRSNGAGLDTKALDEWLAVRQVLRLINNVTSDSLAKFNERASKRKS